LNGEKIIWDEEAGSYWMTATNSDMIDWCIAQGKKAIDAGADMIVLDEIQGDSLIPMTQFATSYLGTPSPGFSDVALSSFRAYLKNNVSIQDLFDTYQIEDIDTYDLKGRIAQTIHLPYQERIEADTLNLVYFDFLDRTNFEAKKQLIAELRSYAMEQNIEIVIAANSYGLGSSRFFGFWPKGLHFCDLVDCFTYENYYFPVDEILASYPQNKWLAWEKLAYAATQAPAITLVDTKMLQQIHPKDPAVRMASFSNYLAILCAEAFANKGSFVDYFIKPWEKEENWFSCQEIYEFVLENTELFDYNAVIDSSIAILYFYGDGMQVNSDNYFGLAQALAESNIPFDVVFDGDGFYVSERIEQHDLHSYDFIILPSVDLITDNQKNLLFDFVKNGGKALVFDPESIGFENEDHIESFGDGLFIIHVQDIGYEYYYTYDESLRLELESLVKMYADDQICIAQSSRDILATPYSLPNKDCTIIHLVNYDHDKFLDTLTIKNDIEVVFKKPDYPVGDVFFIQPGTSEKRYLNPLISDDLITVIVPRLEVYGIIVIERQDEESTLITNPKLNTFYLGNTEIFSIPFSIAILVGNLLVQIDARGDYEIDTVEFYIDNELEYIDIDKPYQWYVDEKTKGFHILKVICKKDNEIKYKEELRFFKIL